MANERVQYDIKDRHYGQLAPSQASRTNFTPGKAVAQAGDQNWPTDFRIPVGTENVDGASTVDMTRVRIVKLDRGIVSDQTLQGVPVDAEGETTLEDDGRFERTSGYDWSE